MGEGAAIANRGEASFEVVRPRVIGAHDASAAVAARPVEEPRRAMAADIVEGTDHAVIATQREEHLAHEVETLEVARVRDLGQVADDLPRRAEHAFALELQEFRVEIGPRRQAEVVGGGWAHGAKIPRPGAELTKSRESVAGGRGPGELREVRRKPGRL